jgi:hypothetical protein
MADHDTHDHTGVPGVGGSSDLDAIIAASSGQDIADALAGAAAPDAGNVFATMADVGGGGGVPLAFVRYAGGSDTNYSLGGGQADVDASNVLVTFTAPASGNVFVYCCAMVQNNGGIGTFGLREATTNIAGPEMVTNAASPTIGVRTFYLTGISGGSHTYKLAGASILIYHGPTYGAIEMIVWAAA